MSRGGQAEFIRERVAGKWQIPLLLVSLALLGGALLQIEPPQAKIPFDRLVERISAAIDGRMYSLAISDSRQLLAYLEQEGGEEAGDAGKVQLLLARALSLRAQEQRPDAGSGREVLDTYRLASQAGQELAWADYENVALANEWLERFEAAVAGYERAAAEAGPRGVELLKRVLELKHHRLKLPAAELREAVDGFLAQVGDRTELLHWAAALKVDLFSSEGRDAEALAFLEELRPVFEPLPEREEFEYLAALALHRCGRYDEAEGALRALRNRLRVRDELEARSGWLLGRTVLYDDGPQRPEEAISFFREVISAHTDSEYAAASRLGMAEALAMLESYEASFDQYSQVIGVLDRYPESSTVNRDLVRSSMTAVAEQLRRAGEYELAVGFLETAAELADGDDVEQLSGYLERLGTWRALLAGTLRDRAEGLSGSGEAGEEGDALATRSVELFGAAADAFLELAQVNTLNESRSAAAMWRAAELLDETGDRERTVAVLREFVHERPNHSLVPRALLRLGQSFQALGRYAEAIEAYQENQLRFPRTPDAGSALIPLAQCFIALGPEHFDQAEKTLGLILDDSPIFTPQAPEFADALFLLGDMLSRRGRFEEAIPRLKESLHRYPRDRRTLRAEFLLADAYRQSGLALGDDLADPRFVGERERLKSEHVGRLREAAERFNRLVLRFESEEESKLEAMEALYLRYARLYEADCWYELGQLDQALKSYERAAWIYRSTPSALAAYVQIINCHRCQGQTDKARSALRRAQYLLKTMAEAEFADGELSGTRSEWSQYFTWVEQSDLF